MFHHILKTYNIIMENIISYSLSSLLIYYNLKFFVILFYKKYFNLVLLEYINIDIHIVLLLNLSDLVK